jgi:hypothetical protein
VTLHFKGLEDFSSPTGSVHNLQYEGKKNIIFNNKPSSNREK